MIRNYQDAMAICRAFGCPDLFITFACNTKWPELLHELAVKGNLRAEDCPHTVSHIYKAKVDNLLEYIKSG